MATNTSSATTHTTAAQDAWTAYQGLRAQLTGRINRELARSTGLSEPDYEVLLALTEAKQQTLRSLELRCGLDWEKSRLSHQLRRMEERGLLSRDNCATDSRSVDIRLTDAGKTAFAAARLCHEAAVERYFASALSEEQLASFAAASTAILARLDQPVHGAH
ncbi:MarR family transcriptional regulator [Leifsonia kafniensis]|uniref:MarR family transcriptional regulator n=1 Tax=Leifsonia kafniensis TaxID=475957 RepID=A0ABP7KW88_9MICO